MATEKENPHNNEESLSSLLTSEERIELTLLVANITEIMRKQTLNAFDASSETMIQRHQLSNSKNEKSKSGVGISQEDEETRKIREKREKELSVPKMLALKKDSLEFFDKWRDSVIERVGTVMNKRKEVTEEQQQKASAEATPDSASPSPPKIICELLCSLHDSNTLSSLLNTMSNLISWIFSNEYEH
jgi:hypothetical protein